MFSKLMFVSAILFLLSANLFAQVADQPITLETGTGKIEGTLLRPETAEKVPIVLIIAGSGPTDRNGNNPSMVNNSLKMLAEGFAQNGIASVRYDKRGVGESKNAALSESELRFENYVEDAVSWVELLGKDIRFSEIIVLGHSEGSLIGMIAAQRARVDKFISVAGVGSPAGDIIREQLKAQPPFVLEQSLPIIEKLEKGETVADVPAMFFSLFRPSVQPYIISWFKYDPQQELAKLAQPILIIQGTTDIQVGVSDAVKLAKANSKAELYIIEGMNHILKEAESDRAKNIATYAMPDLPLKEGLIEVLLGFIR
ncbi:alpha/beta hydrolase [Algoriphagus litoralis]|uniref:alpha/beta hydrolase n=1 Tax=Algoriphagus litoralis TaxID=2202829 RepID=UPI000DB93129|nr:alpha/beta fold hydrolase [Algoriphagus litoralis]